MTIVSPNYYKFCNEQPKDLHIAWYLAKTTKIDLLKYLINNKLCGPGLHHEVHSLDSMHVTLMHHRQGKLPIDYNVKLDIGDRILKPPFKIKVINPRADGKIYPNKMPVAILLFSDMIRQRSDKLHAKFKLKPYPADHQFHLTLCRAQLSNHPKSLFKEYADYNKLPDITFPIIFSSEEVSWHYTK